MNCLKPLRFPGIAPLAMACALLAGNTSTLAGTVTTEGEDIILKTKGGLEVKTASGEYSFRIGGRVHFNYNQYDGVFNSQEDTRIIMGTNRTLGGPAADDGDSASDYFFRRTRIHVRGVIKKDWAFYTQLDFGDDGDVDYKNVHLTYKGWEFADLRIGHFKVPIGMSNLTSSNNVTVIERSIANNAFTQSEQIAAQISKAHKRWTWALALAPNNDADDAEVQYAWTFRATGNFEFGRDGIMHVGSAVTLQDFEDTDGFRISQRPEMRKASSRVATPRFNVKEAAIFTLEWAMTQGPLHAQAEVFNASYEGDADYDFDGYYVQAGWIIGGTRPYSKGVLRRVKNTRDTGALELFFRLSSVDLSDNNAGNEADITTLGLNWYFNSNVRVGLNYVDAEFDEPLYTRTTNIMGEDLAAPIESETDGSGLQMTLQWKF